MASSEKDTAIGLVFADDVGGSGSREDSVLADDELGDTVGGANLKDSLDGLGGEVAAVAANDDGLALGLDRVKDGLDEVLGVVLENDGAR